MNPRERILAFAVLLVVVLAGAGFLFHELFLGPLERREQEIVALEQEVAGKQNRVHQIEADRRKLAVWKQLSLPTDADLAKREYEKYLSGLLQECGIAAEKFSVSPPRQADAKSSPVINGKEPIYIKLPFTVTLDAPLAKVVDALKRFYRTGLMQQIKTLSIQRPWTAVAGQVQGELHVNVTVEALILSGAESRTYLLPGIDRRLLAIEASAALRQGPTGLALLPWALGPTGPLGPGTLARPDQEYAAIARKNIFVGNVVDVPERPSEYAEVTRFVFLTDITRDQRRTEAWLYNRASNQFTRLRPEPGFDSFLIRDSDGNEKVRGKVLRIDSRDLLVQVKEDYYSIHVGQNLEEALKSPLKGEELKTLGLVAAPAKRKNGQ